MSPHPKEPHLFALSFDGNPPMAVVRAMSGPEAREFLLKDYLSLEKLTPARAFNLGREYDGSILNAKPEYADVDDVPAQGDLGLPPDMVRDAFLQIPRPEFDFNAAGEGEAFRAQVDQACGIPPVEPAENATTGEA